MNRNKVRRIIAIIALVFMVIASVTLVIVFINPDYLHGAFGYIALISFLLGVGFFVIVKFVLKEETAAPQYLPAPDDEEDNAAEKANDGQENDENSDSQDDEKDTTETQPEKNSAE